jgi:hypothetical protein
VLVPLSWYLTRSHDSRLLAFSWLAIAFHARRCKVGDLRVRLVEALLVARELICAEPSTSRADVVVLSIYSIAMFEKVNPIPDRVDGGSRIDSRGALFHRLISHNLVTLEVKRYGYRC